MKNMTWVVEYPGVAKWIQWVEENAGVSISPFAASWVITFVRFSLFLGLFFPRSLVFPGLFFSRFFLGFCFRFFQGFCFLL